MTLTYLVQHAQKQPGAGDPELTALGHDQAARTDELGRPVAPGRGPAAEVPGRTDRRAGPVAVASHGGVTVDLLRTLLGDTALPEQLIADGVPPCAITTFDGLTVLATAGTGHLFTGTAG